MERIESAKQMIQNHKSTNLGFYDGRDLPEIFEQMESLLSLIEEQRKEISGLVKILESDVEQLRGPKGITLSKMELVEWMVMDLEGAIRVLKDYAD